jgi:hypothetical protein
MARRADTGGFVDPHPDVAFAADYRLAGVNPHSHLHVRAVGPGVSRKRILCSDGARDGILRARKGNEEGVALGIYLAAVELGERRPEQAMVLLEYVRIAGAESLEQARRPLDVGEEERDGAGR